MINKSMRISVLLALAAIVGLGAARADEDGPQSLQLRTVSTHADLSSPLVTWLTALAVLLSVVAMALVVAAL